MFSIECPFLDREVLLSNYLVNVISTTQHGVVVEFDCVCGAQGVYVTGETPSNRRVIYHQHAPALAEAA
jgi:hypothetical protein